ncbi:MAG: HepT-like ribonuclease domain-containing protein [Hyphomonadaceae bacterium]|nr:HepT-like ribonuclease domain-containing protein [Hyphomonadaceae bacterium]
MPDRSAGHLAEIERSCIQIRSYISGLDRAAFLADQRTQDAVLMQLIVIGEAANALGDDVRSEAPEIAWPRIISLRNHIAHGYDSIDRARIWDHCEDHLDTLEAAVARMLAARGEAP